MEKLTTASVISLTHRPCRRGPSLQKDWVERPSLNRQLACLDMFALFRTLKVSALLKRCCLLQLNGTGSVVGNGVNGNGNGRVELFLSALRRTRARSRGNIKDRLDLPTGGNHARSNRVYTLRNVITAFMGCSLTTSSQGTRAPSDKNS